MIVNGVKVSRNFKLGFRDGNPQTDINLNGEPVSSNYVSIVRIKDCETFLENGRSYYKPDKAPAIPISHGATNYGYGEWKRRKSLQGTWICDRNGENHIVTEYMQCTFYHVKDGIVYTGSIKRPIDEYLLHRAGEQRLTKEASSLEIKGFIQYRLKDNLFSITGFWLHYNTDHYSLKEQWKFLAVDEKEAFKSLKMIPTTLK